jgi:hypothetical protein
MELEDTFRFGAVGAILLTLTSIFYGFGTRKIHDIYSFKYQGAPAVLKQKDVRGGPDQYYFLLNGRDKVSGTLITDDGKKISINDSWRQDNSLYRIEDSTVNQQ